MALLTAGRLPVSLERVPVDSYCGERHSTGQTEIRHTVEMLARNIRTFAMCYLRTEL